MLLDQLAEMGYGKAEMFCGRGKGDIHEVCLKVIQDIRQGKVFMGGI